jgi:hypothetical protein
MGGTHYEGVLYALMRPRGTVPIVFKDFSSTLAAPINAAQDARNPGAPGGLLATRGRSDVRHDLLPNFTAHPVSADYLIVRIDLIASPDTSLSDIHDKPL